MFLKLTEVSCAGSDTLQKTNYLNFIARLTGIDSNETIRIISVEVTLNVCQIEILSMVFGIGFH